MNLSKQSRELIAFFLKNNKVKYISQTVKTKKIVILLYEDIIKANYYCKNNINYNYSIKKIQSFAEITKPQHFNLASFPEIVMSHINKKTTAEITYYFSLYNRKITVHFIVENDIMDTEVYVYNRYIEIVAMWLHIVHNYSSNKCAKTVTIYFYFTSLKKNLPKTSADILNEININTAFTPTCPKDAEIIIYRKEEWFKVFIHETFHAFGLDFSMMNTDSINECILTIYKVNSKVNSYEANTEFGLK